MSKEKQPKERSAKIASKQKKLYLAMMFAVIVTICGFVFITTPEEKQLIKEINPPNTFEVVSSNVNAENIRLSHLENFSDVFGDRLQSLEKSVLDLKEEKHLLNQEKHTLLQETQKLNGQLDFMEKKHEIELTSLATSIQPTTITPTALGSSRFTSWEAEEQSEDRSVLFEIPAGTVVKAILVSGADCSVAVQKPTGPNMVLLRPLDNGKLPKNVSVPLKGSVIIGNAIGDIASERVYIRSERMTLVQKNGDFVETEISAYVSGEDGREGMRGVVVDRSGSIITRAAFASFLQGIGQGLEGYLNNQTLSKLARTSSDQSILNLDMARTSTLQGGNTALNKLSEYYIKRAEQLQPAIQVAAGRIVDIIFTKTIKVGEKDLKKKLAHERDMQKKVS
ncbi:MAG: TraB/VirB10 family protein [Simkaniaceae bacterium]|nr:TraB/VirB10 family protein [Simkaniaceae bacterium]